MAERSGLLAACLLCLGSTLSPLFVLLLLLFAFELSFTQLCSVAWPRMAELSIRSSPYDARASKVTP